MNVLIANVANLESQELRVLAGVLAKNHRVTVSSMAVASHQKGNAFSYGGFPIKFKQIRNYEIGGEKMDAYKFYGTPADMVSIMLGSIMENRKPDVVICGINNGLTIGTDSFCSSNVGMAMEVVFSNVPAVAVAVPIRLGGHTAEELAPVAEFISKNLPAIAAMKMPTDTFLNISCPIVKRYSDFKGIGIASMDNLTQMTKYVEKTDVRGNTYYWTEFVARESADNAEADPTAGLSYFAKNYIIMAPLTYDCTDYAALARMAGEEAK